MDNVKVKPPHGDSGDDSKNNAAQSRIFVETSMQTAVYSSQYSRSDFLELDQDQLDWIE